MSESTEQQETDPSGDDRRRKVFVVHGRNGPARVAMFSFLRSIGLQPIEWSHAVAATGEASPYIGTVLDSAFIAAQAVVVLMTPDEIAYLRDEYSSEDSDPEREPAAQARPNVLFEAGMAMGRDPKRTVLVELGAMRPFSDIAGRHMLRLTGEPERRKELAQRLKTAGCRVDTTGNDWLKSGEFIVPPSPGGSLPLGKRVPRSTIGTGPRVDLRYYERQNNGRLEILNLGSEAVRNVNLKFPPDIGHFHLVAGDLPVEEIPPGKSVRLIAVRSMGPGKNHFYVQVTYESVDGVPFDEKIFLDLVD